MRFKARKKRALGSEAVLLLLLLPAFAIAAAQAGTSPNDGQSPAAQAPAGQPQSDLSDAARRAREERERQRAKRSSG